VIEWLSMGALAIVSLLLLLSLCLQFVQLPAKAAWLDSLAITPQWKFFGQARIASDPAVFDDLHLLVRKQVDGQWQELRCSGERAWHRALWNPHLRHQGAVLGQMIMLVDAEGSVPPTSIAYLTVLRHCLDQTQAMPDDVLQFAIVSRSGCGQRPLSLRFLSAWHRR
jgi:hypothetical protein